MKRQIFKIGALLSIVILITGLLLQTEARAVDLEGKFRYLPGTEGEATVLLDERGQQPTGNGIEFTIGITGLPQGINNVQVAAAVLEAGGLSIPAALVPSDGIVAVSPVSGEFIIEVTNVVNADKVILAVLNIPQDRVGLPPGGGGGVSTEIYMLEGNLEERLTEGILEGGEEGGSGDGGGSSGGTPEVPIRGDLELDIIEP